MANTPATKVVKGTITTDGAGAGSASIVTTGWGVGRIRLFNISLTGGTWSVIDNNGTPGTTFIAAVAPTVEAVRGKTIATAITPLKITIVGGGATKSMKYEVHLEKIDTYDGDLLGWYDFSDPTTLFTDTAMTTPVTADGQSIAAVRDKSGRGAHVTQATAADRPLYKTNQVAGYSTGRFDGSTDFLSRADTAGTGVCTLVAVMADLTGARGGVAAYNGTIGIGVGSVGNIGTPGTYLGAVFEGVGFPLAAVPFRSPVTVAAAIVNNATDPVTFVQNGSAYNVGAPGVSTPSENIFGIGAEKAGVRPFLGDIVEVRIYKGKLSTDAVQNLQAGLMAKYGITPSFADGLVGQGLVAWYDFSDKATLFQDTARTVPIGTTTDLVGGVTAKVGAAHLAATAGAACPRLNLSRNQRSLVTFRSVTGSLSDSTLAARPTATYFLVMGRTIPITGLGGSAVLGNSGGTGILFSNDSGNWVYRSGDVGTGISSVEFCIISINLASAASMVFRKNGGASTSTFDPNDDITTATGIAFGNAPGIAFGNVDLAEVLVYNASLTNAQMDLVGNYLASKWGLTWTAVS